MPQTCTICSHAERTSIESALARGEPLRHIAARFDTSTGALRRHRDNCASQAIKVVQQAQDALRTRTVRDELETLFIRANKLSDACDRWLTDPSQPEQYTLVPRADEISVVYQIPFGDTVITRREQLSALLAQMAGKLSIIPVSIEHKHADPRKLVLAAAAQITKQIELLAKLTGELDERPEINVLVHPQWIEVRQVLLRALQPYPDALEAVSNALTSLPDAG